MAGGKRNEALEGLLAELGWSGNRLANELTAYVRQRGQSTSIAQTTVSRWLGGQKPRPDTARVVCEVLTKALRERSNDPLHDAVVPLTLGWADDAQNLVDASLEYKDVGHAISVSTELWRAVAMERRDLILSALSLPAFGLASREALVMPADADLARAGHQRVGASDIELLVAQTSHYEKLDARFGGGRIWRDFAGFLHNHAAPMLDGTYDDTTAHALYATVANAQILLGWMCHDAGSDGLAQRCHMTAMRFAQAIGDKALIARVFVHDARLVAESGERAEALKVARSAVVSAGKEQPAVRAYAAITEARAWAHTGNKAATIVAVGNARDALAKGGERPAWLGWLDEQELEGQAAWALAMAGDADRAEQALVVARGKDASMKRDNVGLVITAAEIARLRGAMDEHAALTKQAIELSSGVTSGRLVKRIDRLRQTEPVDMF